MDRSDGCVQFRYLWEQLSGNSEEATVDGSLGVRIIEVRSVSVISK